MTPAEREALVAKYRELIALRRDPARDDARLRALAARFPGALRELDTRTMASLEQRALELASPDAHPAWAELQIRFHGWLRVAMRLRAEGVDVRSADAWARAYQPREPGEPLSIDAAALALLLSPPEGRLSLAARALLGAPPEVDLDALLFGA